MRTPRPGSRRARRHALCLLAGLGLAVVAPLAASQGPVPDAFARLPGRWVRPDGGYTVDIRAVDAQGRLDASYANPSPLPFAKAQATLDGNAVTVFLELRAGGYNGSTYTLRYDPARDTLHGVYYQAVAQQKYEVRFVRTGP